MGLPLLLPVIAAVLYATGALLIKRAAELGVGVWRTAFVANTLGAVCFLPLLFLGGTFHAALWLQPVVVGLLFVVGQWLTFLSLDRGDVTIATPVLGLKVLFVAVLVTWITGTTLRPQLWIGAALATAGIALMNLRAASGQHHHVGRTIVTAACAAASYAVFDALVQRWAPAWGTGFFLPIAMGVSALASCSFIPLFRAPLTAIPVPARGWLVAGTMLLGLQSVTFTGTIAQFGNAAPANIVYSSRGLWTIVLVWLAGHLVRSREQHLGRATLAFRLGGALLMMSAIVLVLA